MNGDASRIAEILEGRENGPGRWLCRCPMRDHGKGRGDRNPSLSIAEGDTAILVNCFAGCATRDVLDELRRRGILVDDRPIAPPRKASPRSEPVHRPDAGAVAIWRAAVPGAGTVVEDYLARRGIILPVPPSLRLGRTGRDGLAMIAAVQAPDRQVIAVQSTALTPEGAKARVAMPRLTTGAMGRGAVRLAAATEVLGLAEGVETALSAMQLSGVPTWASLGGQRLAKIAVPADVRELHLFGDNDAAGRLAAETAADRYTRDGLTVHLRWPPDRFGDWNDALRDQAREALTWR